MSLWKVVLGSSFFQSFATKEVRHLATAAAGAIMTYLGTHGGDQSAAASVAQAVSGLIVGAFGYGLSLLNASDSKAVASVAAATGTVLTAPVAQKMIQQGVVAQRQADTTEAARVDAAIKAAEKSAPADRAALLAELAGGGPK